MRMLAKPLTGVRSSKVDAHNVVIGHARSKEVVGEQLEEQVRLPAAPNAGDYLYQSVPLAVNELTEISVAFYFHTVLNFRHMCQLFQEQRCGVSLRTPSKWR